MYIIRPNKFSYSSNENDGPVKIQKHQIDHGFPQAQWFKRRSLRIIEINEDYIEMYKSSRDDLENLIF